MQAFYEDENSFGNLLKYGYLPSVSVDTSGRSSSIYIYSAYVNYTDNSYVMDSFYFTTVTGTPVSGAGVTVTPECFKMPIVQSFYAGPAPVLGYGYNGLFFTGDKYTQSYPRVLNKGGDGNDEVAFSIPVNHPDNGAFGIRAIHLQASSSGTTVTKMTDYYSKTSIGYFYPAMTTLKDGSDVVGYTYGGPDINLSVGVTKVSKTGAISCINDPGTYQDYSGIDSRSRQVRDGVGGA